MQLAQELYDCMKNQLSHFHISGQNESSRHVSLYNAMNKEGILNFYNKHQELIAIEEGVIIQNYDFEIDKELSLLRD